MPPIKPVFAWEQDKQRVFITVTLKGVKKDAIDVLISDQLVKINAKPYLLQVDLFGDIEVDESSHRFEAPNVLLRLKKSVEEPWPDLQVTDNDPKTIAARRQLSRERASEVYRSKLESREKKKEEEKKRMFHEHWELEKQQRSDIEGRMEKEHREEDASLTEWKESLTKEGKLAADGKAQKTAAAWTPADVLNIPVREKETKVVPIDFTPKSVALPSRSRADEDYYRKSKYRPKSIQDAPVFWKERADAAYKKRDYKGAVEAYSEAIKRDGTFLACIANRAACYIKLHKFQKAVQDCDLAITMLSNTPASDTTSERYRAALMKLHIRRGAALCWDGQVSRGYDDYKLAAAYRTNDDRSESAEILADIKVLDTYMQEKGLVAEHDPKEIERAQINHLYMAGKYEESVERYSQILEADEFDYKARSNLCAALLHLGRFQESLQHSTKLIEFCHEVAAALDEPGVQAGVAGQMGGGDSDDDEDLPSEVDEGAVRRNAAATVLRERSGHVYLLLKSFVRAGAACCGLKDFHKGHQFMEKALRITPYDDDLREDCQRIAEKLQMTTLVSLTTNQSPESAAAKLDEAKERSNPES